MLDVGRAVGGLARFQLLTADGVAHLVALEQHRWWLLATYA